MTGKFAFMSVLLLTALLMVSAILVPSSKDNKSGSSGATVSCSKTAGASINLTDGRQFSGGSLGPLNEQTAGAGNASLSYGTGSSSSFYSSRGLYESCGSPAVFSFSSSRQTEALSAAAFVPFEKASNVLSAAAPEIAGGYAVHYTINLDWGVGATVTVLIKNNTAAAVQGWAIEWTFTGNQTVSQVWNASETSNGHTVIARNTIYNKTIPANGGTQSFGFNLIYSGTNAAPEAFHLNGIACSLF